jgi:hypothetical protein
LSDNDTMKGANYNGIADMVATVDDGLDYDDSRD